MQIKKALAISQKLLSCGSEVVLLACTEFAVMFQGLAIAQENTIDILVEAVVEKYKELF